jgi:hypothetical protein
MAPPQEQGSDRFSEVILEAVDQTIADIEASHGRSDPRLQTLHELRERIAAESLDTTFHLKAR